MAAGLISVGVQEAVSFYRTLIIAFQSSIGMNDITEHQFIVIS